MANRFIGGVASSKANTGTSISRASTGTYFDSSGVLRTAPANHPRLNHSFVGSAWTQPTALIEPERTNLNPYSQDFSSPNWGAASSTITPNSITAPDGTTTASLWALNSGSGEHYLSRSTTLIEGQLTYSVFAKPAGRNWIILNHNNSTNATYTYFNISTGTIGTTGSGVTPSIVNAGNGWYRCVVTINHSAAAHGTNGPQLYIANDTGTSSSFTGDGVSGIYIWGVQIEQGYGVTSYIPTAGTAVTRAADVVAPTSQPLLGLNDHYNLSSTDSPYKIDTYTLVDTNYAWTAPEGVEEVEVLVVAGGGSGGNAQGAGGGGGAGGLIYNSSYSVKPGTTYPVVVGAGGAGRTPSTAPGINGKNSQFGSLIAIGGGGGSAEYDNGVNGRTGGSGGGNCYSTATDGAPGIAGQGHSGGPSSSVNGSGYETGGGGGGAGGAGGAGTNTGTASTSTGGNGGPGLYFNISGSSIVYAGGGGGANNVNASTPAGLGGSGIGGSGGARTFTSGTPGIDGTGSGGGGGGTDASSSGAGGSGIVIVKYRRKSTQAVATTTDAIVTQKFTTSNTWTVPEGVTEVEALVVAGGGGGGAPGGSGGGAGGLIYNSTYSVTPGGYCSISVGSGGAGGVYNSSPGGKGGDSVFATSGANIVANGSFDTDTNWVKQNASVTIAGGVVTCTNGSADVTSDYFTITSGTTYTVVWTCTSFTSGANRVLIRKSDGGVVSGGQTTTTRTATGTYSYTFTATETTSAAARVEFPSIGTSSVDNVGVFTSINSIVATGGGGGGGNGAVAVNANGGSGAGAAPSYVGGSAGTGIAGQGFAGGSSGAVGYGGGGGAGGPGTAGNDIVGGGKGGDGGPGLPYAITGNLEYYAGGGGGGVYTPTGTLPGYGGIGGGGSGTITNALFNAGASNTGGGGGGVGGGSGAGSPGGSGVAILRYRVPAVAEFKDSGTWTCPAGVYSVQALVVAGGGGGGYCNPSDGGGGGGGGGGLVYSTSIPVTPGTTYPVVIGQGGIASTSDTVAGFQGGNSSFASIIALGGGGGGSTRVASATASVLAGGSGGGAGSDTGGDTGGAGTYGQGNSGGNNNTGNLGAGGGGAGAAAISVTSGGDIPNGGSGLAYSISGTSTYYAGGGGGGKFSGGPGAAGSGGLGGGGAGGKGADGTPGVQNTGGGGGGGGMISGVSAKAGAAGGSGIVIIRWFEN